MNESIFYFFYSFAHQSVLIDNFIIFFAEVFQYLFLILCGLFLLFHHEIFKAENPFQFALQKYKELSFVFISGFFGWMIAKILKILIQAERPFDIFQSVQPLFNESSYAFPSSHATIFMALATALFLKHKKAGYVFIFFAFLIGVSRIASGVHSPVDIFGGFVLGILIAYLTKYLYTKFAYFRKNV